MLFFEQVRTFFLETSGSKKTPEFPVRIVAFNSEKQYAPYRARSTAFAYYTSGRMRDYIVMRMFPANTTQSRCTNTRI